MRGLRSNPRGDRRLCSRITDSLRLKGFLVNPGEVEELLIGHSDVASAQVVGVADISTGEDRAVAFVIAHRGAEVTAEQLRAHCADSAASYKVPSAIEVVDQFPMARSANGDKVVKHRLRAMAEEVLER